tara:strand:- start:427 stop:1335 length:909 start_codon:yes stop_codon:yes gene_type:complete
MAFLDNSGDIILDAVLTDTGRMRLAKGDGSFKITKFAMGDDEINYALYNRNHASGSAYYDLDILQTPVLEAFTNNASSMKSKLVSMSRTNLLYLPMCKLNTLHNSRAQHTSGSYMIAVDQSTENRFGTVDGVMYGENPGEGGGHIRVDQGLDTTEVSPTFTIDADLVETQYIIEIDNRFGSIVSSTNGSKAAVSFIDDDNIASYFLSLGTDVNYVRENTNRRNGAPQETIAGPRGTTLNFKIQSSLDLNTSTYLFTTLGSTAGMHDTGSNETSVRYIDTNVRVNGATTGYQIDIPVRFIKLI